MPRSSRPVTVMPIVVREAQVVETLDLTPSMQRIIVTGDELRGGTSDAETNGTGARHAFTSLGFDDHVKLVFAGDRPRSWIGTQQDYAFDWNREALASSRDYTVRSYDEATNRLVLDVVRHAHGVAADWFAACKPGDVLHMAGPKTSMPLSEGIEEWLLIGDETALPAIARFFDEIDEDASVRALIEVPTEADRQPLRELPGAQVTWLVRDGVPAGESDALMKALEQLEPPTGRLYAWCAGEAITLTPIRRHLRNVWNVPKEDMEVVGYWRKPARAKTSAPATADSATSEDAASTTTLDRPDVEGQPEAGKSEAGEPDTAPDARLQAMYELHEMTEILPPVVTRLAATFDLTGHVASGQTTLDAISAACGLAPAPLESLLDAMTSLGLLTRADGHYGLTDTGALLAEEDVRDELTLTDPANRLWFDLLGLDDVLRSGLPTERTLAARREQDPALDSALDGGAQDLLRYLFDPLAELPALQNARRVVVLGEAAQHVTHELAGRLTQADVVCGGFAPDITSLDGDIDTILTVGHFAGLSPQQAETTAAVLVARARCHVVAVENLRDGAADDDHLAEADLQTLASTGHPLPSSTQLQAVLRDAGARSAETVHPGWGFGTYNAVVVADV